MFRPRRVVRKRAELAGGTGALERRAGAFKMQMFFSRFSSHLRGEGRGAEHRQLEWCVTTKKWLFEKSRETKCNVNNSKWILMSANMAYYGRLKTV